MKRANPVTASIGLLLALPMPGQDRAANWIDVAQQIGGSGVAHDGRYVRLISNRGWTDEATPPAWIEFRRLEGAAVVRGTIPVLREHDAAAVRVLEQALPDAEVVVSDSYGAASPRVHIRVLATGDAQQLATSVRGALERIEPGALARIQTTGIVEKDSFEGEEDLVVRTVDGERVNVGRLPAAVAHEWAHVRLVAHRKNARPGRFLYHGAADNWRTMATLDRIEALAPAPAPPDRPCTEAAWAAVCRAHARSLLQQGEPTATRLARPLASGFGALTDPGFAICPRCQHALTKDWLFADAGLEAADASLRRCARDALYFLGRDGFDHGPFFPDLDAKEQR